MRLIYFSVNQKCQNSTGANLKMLRPIETKYAGRRFRSRREARWAILFDHLEIDWRYEPEGYQLSGGVNYLPDFELHLSGGSRIWVEVKPELSPYDSLQRLVHESRRLGVLVAEPTLRTDVLGARVRLSVVESHQWEGLPELPGCQQRSPFSP